MEMLPAKLSASTRAPEITHNPMLKEGLVDRAAFLADDNFVEEKDTDPDAVDANRATFAAYIMGVNDYPADETSMRAFIMNNPGNNAERS